MDDYASDCVMIKFDVYCPRTLIESFETLRHIFKNKPNGFYCTDYCIKIRDANHDRSTSDAMASSYVLQLELSENDAEITKQDSFLHKDGEPQQQITLAKQSLNPTSIKDQQHSTNNLKSDAASTSDTSMTGQATSQTSSLQGGDSLSNIISRQSVPTGKAESQKSAESGKAALVLPASIILYKELDINMQHALHHSVHGYEGSCPYYNDTEQCKQNYDQKVVNRFNIYINGWKIHGNYEDYILDHLQSRKCGGGCPLWKYYVENKLYLKYNIFLKCADEGLVIHSKINKEKMGKVCEEYSDYEKSKSIGSGGFGEVYRYTEELAIKQEFKRPLIMANPKMFDHILHLEHENVISVQEYLVGKEVEKEKRIFLFVMPYLNKGGLNDQFRKHKCVLDYMIKYPEEEENIFDNFLTLFLQVFKGLEYLHGKKIVHGDVKDANILVQQTCTCKSPLRCKCRGHIGVTYVLTDMDLLCFDGQSITGRYVKWCEMKLHEPAGTPGMKASELYFTGEKGEPCVSSKSDIWAGCVAMMKALVGKNANDEAKIQIAEFFEQVTVSGKKYSDDIFAAYRIVRKIQKNVKLLDLTHERPAAIPFLKKQAAEIVMDFSELRELLTNAQLVKETQHISSYICPTKFPLAMILSAVHVANSLHQSCLEKLPHVYNKSLWQTMKASMLIITDGVRFLPLNRPNATIVTEKLTALLLGFDDDQDSQSTIVL